MTSRPPDPAGLPSGHAQWPVRSGAVPSLAEAFISRPESAPGLLAELQPGATVALLPARAGLTGATDWRVPTGRTQLAADCAGSLWRSRRIEALFWVTASSRASLLAGYGEAAAAVLGGEFPGTAESIAHRLLSWLNETSRPWLVVLDDARDAEDLDELWPTGPAGTVLITAADANVLPRSRLASFVPVGPFSARESMSYLRARLAADTDQRTGMIDLVADLGGEPMALAQAGGVVVTSRLSCRDYLEELTARRQQAIRVGGGTQPAASVTWTFSAEHADRLSDGLAWPVLTLAALLDGHAIPLTVFASSAVRRYLTSSRPEVDVGAEDVDETLLIADQTGLLDLDPTASALRMNQALQAAIRATTPASSHAEAVQAAADGLLEVWPAAEHAMWLPSALRMCVFSLQRAAGDLLWTDGCHPVLLRAGQSLVTARLTQQACMYWNDLAAVADRVLGRDHPETLMIAGRLADAHLAAGDPDSAVAVNEWIVNQLAAGETDDDVAVIAARLDFGRALAAAGDLGNAITILDRATKDYERLLGADHLETIRANEQLAAVCRAGPRPTDAIEIYQRALAYRERIQGPAHPDTATTRQKLADAYLAADRVKEAVNHFKKVVADRERLLGTGHLDTVAARGDLAAAYHAAGKMALAIQLHEQAREGYETILGPNHPDTLARRANLASAYYAVGRVGDATALLRDTLERCERVLPPRDPLTLAIRENLTNVTGT